MLLYLGEWPLCVFNKARCGDPKSEEWEWRKWRTVGASLLVSLTNKCDIISRDMAFSKTLVAQAGGIWSHQHMAS